MDDAALVVETAAFAERLAPDRKLGATARARLKAAMPSLKLRAKTLAELVDNSAFMFADGPRAPDAAAAALLAPAARARLARLAKVLDQGGWDAAGLEARIRAFAEHEGIKLGEIAQPLRAALTGRTTSPPVFDMLAVLGRDESLTRIRAHAE